MPQSNPVAGRRPVNRWVQLAAGIACMVMIANLQYGWTLFVHPINDKHGWGRSAIQVAFTVFVLAETWLVPFEGLLVDRMGPRWFVFLGGLLAAAGWAINAAADSLMVLYLGAVVAGTGAACVYGTCVGNAMKWFPDKRGLATGLTAMGFGIGTAFTVVPIQETIHHYGYESAFLWFGLGQGIVVCLACLVMTAPRSGETPAPSHLVHPGARDYAPPEMLRSLRFWMLYVMLVLVAAGGLMFTAQMSPIARDFQVDGVPVTLLGLTLPALTFAITLDRLTNGITRPFSGWISDRLGRENTMFVIFALEALGIWAFDVWGHDPVLFVILGGLVFFAWGEYASLFPATCTDYFGVRYATTNAGILYTAKGVAALLVPLASLLAAVTGDWHAVFAIAIAMNATAAFIAVAVLRPLRGFYRARHA
jgi:OFA family oxalate/formate antiporter-like MFS transporter